MVVKNPFLCEKDHEIQFIARNEGAYRGLSALFPAAKLSTLVNVALVAERKKLYSSRYVYNIGSEETQKKTRTQVSQASTVLSKELGRQITEPTYQNYLNLACDLRILRHLAGVYYLHSYGIPLVVTAKQRNWSLSSKIEDFLAIKCFFIDKLLFEDGDYLRSVIESLSQSVPKTSTELGVDLHDKVFKELKIRKDNLDFDRKIKDHLSRKINEYENIKRDPDRSLRRTELEYTVRRDWLHELGLAEKTNDIFQLSDRGKILQSIIRDQIFDNDFFTKKIVSVFSAVYGLTETVDSEMLDKIESVYELLSNSHLSIIETLVLVNSSIFLSIPKILGERDSVLNEIRDSFKHSSSRLILQSGYRTREYYVKMKR